MLGILVLWEQTTSAPAVNTRWSPSWRGSAHSSTKATAQAESTVHWGPSFKGKGASASGQSTAKKQETGQVHWSPSFRGKVTYQGTKTKDVKSQSDSHPYQQKWGSKVAKTMEEEPVDDDKLFDRLFGKESDSKDSTKSQSMTDEFEKMYSNKEGDKEMFQKMYGNTDDKAQMSELHQLEKDLEVALKKAHSLASGK